MRFLSRALACAAAVLLAACSQAPATAPETDTATDPATAQGPVVLAASSLQEAMEDVAAAWTAQGHAAPVLSFAGSSALARQAEAGAPADLFVSADEEWMDYLAAKDLLRAGSRHDLLTNRLVLVAPKGGAALDRAQLAAALAPGRLALADPDAVPAGKYARAALQQLGLWQGVAARVVPAENVRAALALVERGQVPFAAVYATDAQASARVAVVFAFPAGSHPPIRYPAAMLAGARHPDAAGFARFLASPTTQALFRSRGFGIAG